MCRAPGGILIAKSLGISRSPPVGLLEVSSFPHG